MADSVCYGLYSGFPEHDAKCIAVIEGFLNACERMNKAAAEQPGHYFVFCFPTQNVLAEVDTATEGG
jgi:hypothetical protein